MTHPLGSIVCQLNIRALYVETVLDNRPLWNTVSKNGPGSALRCARFEPVQCPIYFENLKTEPVAQLSIENRIVSHCTGPSQTVVKALCSQTGSPTARAQHEPNRSYELIGVFV